MSEDKEKQKKKPLSLNISVSKDDLDKRLEEKEKINRARGPIVDRINVKKEVPIEVKSIVEEEEINEKQEVNKFLTEEEINRRKEAVISLEEAKKKALEERKEAELKKEEQPKKDIIKVKEEEKEEEKEESKKEEENFSKDKEVKEEQSKVEVESKKPLKKSTLSQNKGDNIKNWKAMYEQNTSKEVLENQPQTYHYNVKRKNKRRDAAIKYEKVYKSIELSDSISVKDLALRLSEKSIILIKCLETLDYNVNKDSILDIETAEIVATELGHRVEIVDKTSVEAQYLYFEDSEKDLEAKPPVVTIMGHVDHGKTTLLDTIRKANIVDQESGGITQHIGAYQVKASNNKVITFLDTPGHEAFSQIRQRGSSVTDIVILVVAANDGVKPQTIEAINHAKAAGVPIIVAINKIDIVDSNAQKVKTELLQHEIIVEEMGGENLCVEISAKENKNIDKLLEVILLQAEVLDLKSNYKALGKATIIEVKTAKGFGILASILVGRGKVKVGDFVVCGSGYFKVKSMMDYQGKKVKEALPSMPVEVSGFNDIPDAGDDFLVVPSESKAKELIKFRIENKEKQSAKSSTQDLVNFFSQEVVSKKTLNIIIKADTQGSLDAIKSSLQAITNDEIEIKFTNFGVGEINESDINLAINSQAIVIGFNSRGNVKAKELARKQKIDIRYHSIIYNLIDDVKLILSGLLDPDIVENIIGYAEVREVFNISKQGKIAGCFVKEGSLKRSAQVRVLRNNVVIHEGELSQLKRFKEDVKEVKTNFECGVSIENYNDIEANDLIECYESVEVLNSID